MATTATTIKAKLETTITGLTVAADSEKFEIMREDEDEGSIVTSANERRFEIFHFGGEDRVGESADAGYHHPTEGTVTERFQIAVFYPFKKDHRAQDSAIREDVQKIKAALNDPANWSADVEHQWVIQWPAPAPNPIGFWAQLIVVEVKFVESSS